MNNQQVCEFMSRGFERQKFSGNVSVVAYPQNDAREIAKIMNDIRVESLPVLFSPGIRKSLVLLNLIKLAFS